MPDEELTAGGGLDPANPDDYAELAAMQLYPNSDDFLRVGVRPGTSGEIILNRKEQIEAELYAIKLRQEKHSKIYENDAVYEYKQNRAPVRFTFDPPIDGDFVTIGETYLFSITFPQDEEVAWRIHEPPGHFGTADPSNLESVLETHASKIIASGSTRSGIFKPTRAGSYAFAFIFTYPDPDGKTMNSDIRAFKDVIVMRKHAVKRRSALPGILTSIAIVTGCIFFIIILVVVLVFAYRYYSKYKSPHEKIAQHYLDYANQLQPTMMVVGGGVSV